RDRYMPLMFNEAELAAMWDVKEVFDPQSLLNPGKVFPTKDTRRGGGGEEKGGDPWVAQSGMMAGNDLSPVRDEGDASVPTPLHTAPAPTRQGPTRQVDTMSPTSAEEAANILLSATEARRGVRIRGCAETSQERGDALSLVLSTTQLQGIKTYAADDLYVTVGAGTTLAEIQAFLAPEQKQVPMATPWSGATIGGLIATNVNAPLRMRYGSIRDLVLCATVVLADGRVLRVGRPVIKNVAGFDLVKVFVGAHGTLGLITDVTLKLVVQPRTQRTLLIPVADYRHGLAWARKLLPLAMVASALLLCKDCAIPGDSQSPTSPYMLVYSAEGVAEDVQAELDQVRKVLRTMGTMEAHEPIEVEGLSGTEIWAALLAGSTGKLQVRAGVAAKDVATYINDQADVLNEGAFLADMSSGLVYAVATRVDAVEEARAWLEKIRRPAIEMDGYAVVMDMPGDWQGVINRWGYQPQAMDLMQRLKQRWDQQGILNGGEFIV
ncbi:MAG TPA: FAD-binding oxidoreductase, partial [Ktedonobacter sp.]|nr:FAD-binding oxidoreductase [Ktedonobacter sp.]